jgi:hypothetical protein
MRHGIETYVCSVEDVLRAAFSGYASIILYEMLTSARKTLTGHES